MNALKALKKLNLRVPATEEEITRLVKAAPRLPSEYLAFLRLSDGAAGEVGAVYVSFLPVKDSLLVSQMRHESGLPAKYLVFANDGSNADYAFDLATDPYNVVKIDKIDDEVRNTVAFTFADFVGYLGRLGPGYEVQYTRAQADGFLRRSAEFKRNKRKNGQ